MSRKNLPPFNPNERLDSVTIGQAVRMFREVSALSQAALAEASDLSQTTISNLESGKSFTVDNLNKAAEGLNVSVRALIDLSFQIEQPTEAFRESMKAFETMLSIAREANETEVQASARPFLPATTERDLPSRAKAFEVSASKVIEQAKVVTQPKGKPAARA